MIPDYQTLMRPVLNSLSDGEVRRSRDVKEEMAELFDLTDEERLELLPSGRQRTIDNRVGWALTYLSQAGLIERPRRGHVQISDEGRAALRMKPDRIDNKVLETYPKFLEFRERTRSPDDQAEPDVVPELVPERTPGELVAEAVRVNRAAVEGEVLRAALELSPTAFEELVVRLLSAMGYGKSGSLERTSASGDAGVDGIISQDPLGLDRIYVQAKRYAVDKAVSRPKIHEFAGALLGKQGDRGVFITTSSFTQGAQLEAERINARIELIDGARLAQLLVLHGVGVQVETSVTLHGLDEDFFENL